MITMDLKGITWVGHVYQKFEAMCLEVEEVMYQDTVKYFEEQVQTVGASVKKLCSDVMQDAMQDFLLPSSLEPVKAVAASDTPVEKYAGTLKKPNVGLKEAAIKGKGEQLTEESEVLADVNKNAAQVPFSCQILLDDNIFESRHVTLVERADSGLLSSNVENIPLAETFSEAAVVNKFSRVSSFSGNANANHEESCQQISTTSTQVLVEEDDCDSIQESCNEIEIESASESILAILNNDSQLVESIAKKEMEERFSSCGIGSAESNVGGKSNKWTKDTSVSMCSDVGRKEIETVQPLDKTGVDDSCILVNGAELHIHHQREGKHRPYQKKIRDAISSRMRSARKKEYERLAIWYGDDVKSEEDCERSSMSALKREDTRRSSLAGDVLDSEWELL